MGHQGARISGVILELACHTLPLLQIWKLRLRKTKELTQACKWSSQGLYLCFCDSKSHDSFPDKVISLIVNISKLVNHALDFAQCPLIECLSDVKYSLIHSRSVY